MKNMLNRGLILAASVAFLTPALTAADAAKDEAKEIAKTPQAVLETVNKEFPGAKITDCDKEKEDGVEAYEVKLTDANGAKHTLHVAATGKLITDKNKTTGEKKAGEPAK